MIQWFVNHLNLCFPNITRLFLKMIITMNLLWTFNFGEAIDPITKERIPVDINDFSEVCPFLKELIKAVAHGGMLGCAQIP